MVNLHIGFDDTDSPRGGCTTHIAALLVEKLAKLGVRFIDYPNLIRLNPNVPWKTRGNGALCLRIECNRDLIRTIFEMVASVVEENSDMGFVDTDPGIVFFQGKKIPLQLRQFAERTIQNIVRIDEALNLIKSFNCEALGFRTGYGIVGALAAVGETLEGDHTYEVITYRKPENWGTKRKLDLKSVEEMDQKMKGRTYNNVDEETGRILITPRGPDPIFYGIRGETGKDVLLAQGMIRSSESVERYVLYRTNQGTDAHLRRMGSISDIRPFNSVIVNGVVSSMPKLVPKRHRIFTVKDSTGCVECAAYEPTGTLRKVARQLMIGDEIEVCGGVRSSGNNPLTINLEKIRLRKLSSRLIMQNPRCLKCDKRMKSAGKGKGFKCPSCSFRSLDMQKKTIRENRDLKKGLFVTSPRSQRHLTKPLCRYGKEKSGKPVNMLDHWHRP